MLSVVFIIPPENHYIESNVSPKIEKGREFRQKLGLLYVGGYVRHATGIDPTIVDCLADGWSLDDLEAHVGRTKPDIIGFSVLTFNILDCLDAARVIRRASPKTKICFGGFHATIYPNESLALPEVDFVVFGDGEMTFAELVSVLSDGGDDLEGRLAEVKGLGWMNASGEAVMNLPRPMITRTEFDGFPMPAHDLLDFDKYSVVLADTGRVASIQTSRGCPAKCTFCDIRMTPYRYRTGERIVEEIRYLKEMDVNEFFIVDDTFTINRNRVLDVCQRLVDENLDIKFKVSSRVDSIDEEMLGWLKKAGCYRIHYGVESGSQRLLDFLEKGITPAQVKNTFEITRRAGIGTYAYMMIGIPTETPEEMERSIRFVDELKPDHVNYSICTPFPKTKLYETYLAENPDQEDYWAAFARAPSPGFKLHTANEYMTTEQLRELQGRALRRFYSSPRLILRETLRTRSWRQFRMKAGVGLRLLMPRSA